MRMPKVLTVEPTAGLGNRLRVVASSLELAEMLGCPLRIVWTRTPDLNCRFRDLFLPSPAFAVVESSWTASRVRRRIFGRWRYDAYFDDRTVAQLGSAEAVSHLTDRQTPFVITCHRFRPAIATRNALPLAPLLQGMADGIVATFTPHTIGVHVRRADHETSPVHSPSDAFVEAMRRAIDDDPEADFFLATDAVEEARVIEAAFPGRVRTFTRELRRHRKAAALCALVDMECLGHCRYVLGSYHSSFSEVAAERGGVPLIVALQKGADPPPPLLPPPVPLAPPR